MSLHNESFVIMVLHTFAVLTKLTLVICFAAVQNSDGLRSVPKRRPASRDMSRSFFSPKTDSELSACTSKGAPRLRQFIA